MLADFPFDLSIVTASRGCGSVISGMRIGAVITESKDKALDLMMNSTLYRPNELEYQALGRYKGDLYSYINENSNNPKCEDTAALSKLLSRNPLMSDIRVRRDDSSSILSHVKVNDNLTLKDILDDPVRYSGEIDKINRSKSLIGKSFINEYFMSTTVLSGGSANHNSNVTWDLTVKKGTGAFFIDVVGLSSEGEILLDHNCKITITGIDVGTSYGSGFAKIKATVEPANK